MSDETVCLQSIHFVLAANGFRRSASISKHIYGGVLSKSDLDFPIQIEIFDPFFVRKPDVILLSKPDSLPTRLPHVFADKHLCYLDDQGAEFDRYDPVGNITLVLASLHDLLDQYATKPELLQQEFRRELPAYWQQNNEELVYLAAESSKNIVYEYFHYLDPAGTKLGEIIVADDATGTRDWRRKRQNAEQIGTGHAVIVSLPTDIEIPDKDWPPTQFTHVAAWLKASGHQASYQRLVTQAFEHIATSSSCFFIFQLQGMFLGGLLSFRSNRSRRVIREKFKRTRPGRRGRQKKLDVPLHRKVSLLSSLQKYESADTFQRLNVRDVRASTVYTRNLVYERNLSTINIAVIGCGTLGGYVASLLQHAGAGTGGGSLALYDADELHPENLGRHLLSSRYLGQNKATALATELNDNPPVGGCVHAIPSKVDPCEYEAFAKQYDLVVDTTGEITFSTSLCHEAHRSEYMVPVLYGWIDAGGLAARTLLDQPGSGLACYACLKTRDSTGKIGERFQLFKNGVEIPSWQPRPCGIGGFLPFPTQASVTAAGLAQAQSLDWINNSPAPRFRHISLDPRACDTKSADLKPLKECPCCQT